MTQQATGKRRVEIYDTTLRDGAQGEGVAFSLVDKLRITEQLDQLGVDYIEGGYPLSNPKDAAYFAEARKLKLRHSKVCAFGMTRRKGSTPAEDVGMKALVEAGAPIVTIVGKTWDLHVDKVLGVSREENLAMIKETLAFCKAHVEDVFYDAEHFFDGFRANKDYALETLDAARVGGAARFVLCDTNGGSLPAWIAEVIGAVHARFGKEFKVGIHVHNDGGLAVANTLTAVEHGAVQVQGTINGIGERCGNVDLTTVVANLRLKLGYDCLTEEAPRRLTEISRFVYETANLNLSANQPFVGTSAFAHKGGMHVNAVQKVAHSYEHVEPESVGNSRRVLISELSGASNVVALAGDKFKIGDNKQLLRKVLEKVQDLEHQGYQFEAAQASFELLLREVAGQRPALWELDHYRCVIAKRNHEAPLTEATVKVKVGGKAEHHVAEGDGPVNALDGALRRCLEPHFPQLKHVHLRDFKVRVVNPTAESAAKVRVISEFAVLPPTPPESPLPEVPPAAEGGGMELKSAAEKALCSQVGGTMAACHFTTIGVNENVVDAAWQAITDAFAYFLLESGVGAAG